MRNDHRQQRLVVPDIARGLALLGIAVANAISYWLTPLSTTVTGRHPGTVIDQAATIFAAMFVHVRGLPMFSTLLGFGFGLVAASLARKGYPSGAAKRVLARRYGFLALFGVAHMWLLFSGDIMLTYGLIGVLMALLVNVRSGVLYIISGTILGLSCLVYALMAVLFFGSPLDLMAPTPDASSFAAYFADNQEFAFYMTLSQPLVVIQLGALSLLGFVWARDGVLTDVKAHARTLWVWVGVAVAVVIAIGIPLGLAQLGILPASTATFWLMLNQSFGLLTGPGILAAFALATQHWNQQPPRWTMPIIALGKRSMSGYLLQTFVLLPTAVLISYGWLPSLGEFRPMLLGTAVWLLSVALASALEHFDKQGPFEALHRHLSYGRTGRIEPYPDPATRKALPHEHTPNPSSTAF